MHEVQFRAMGTNVHLIVVGGDEELLERGRARLDDLERRWSRFIADSELSTLNALAGSGEPVALTSVTFDLVTAALDAWRASGGVFDPTILPSLVAAGYDRSFDEGHGPTSLTGHVSRCSEIVIDDAGHTVVLPAGCALDLGGIGKGRAADLVAADLLEEGADGVCINLGGDLRVAGVAPDDAPAWAVAVDDPTTPAGTHDLYVVGLADAALATSSTTRRRWESADGTTLHHLIDPRTGRPATTGIASVTVIASTAVAAELAAKVSLIEGAPSDDALPMLFVHEDGRQRMFAAFEEYVW